VLELKTNYRSIKTLVDAGAKLIENNGACQIQKPALSNRKETKPIFVYASAHTDEELYREQTAKHCLNRISEYLERGFSANDVLVLTRYMRTKIEGRTEYFKIIRTFLDSAKHKGIRVAVDHAQEHNAIKLLTVHKCKGLEAKVVFVLNVVKGQFGFPSEIEDPAILEVARGDNGIEDQKEERRLFYVAITRAKEDLYIYTKQKENSEFLGEVAAYTSSVPL
jgi:DNA helicase-4